MEFYKLYFILHRRTDWHKLWRWQRQIMMPEWYEERERRAETAYRRLMIPFMIMDQCMERLGYEKI